MIRAAFILGLLTTVLAACANRPKSTEAAQTTEQRAIEFLQREVPAWSRDNGCFSCHNNGDAARALFAASQKGYRIPRGALADTTTWIASPAEWDHNKGDPGFSDKRLADLQFTASLAAALESGHAKAEAALNVAALKVANAQAEDGSWPVDSANSVGSPTTYGTALATYMAWDSLRRISMPEITMARQKAEERLSAIELDSVPNAAVVLLFHRSRRGNEADGPQMRNPPPHVGSYNAALNFLRRTQTSDGGWGPYADSPPEAFDTALALLALAVVHNEDGVPGMIQRGRAHLTITQLADGSWPATTRPSGGQSYAQQMSTTGWATLALLATR